MGGNNSKPAKSKQWTKTFPGVLAPSSKPAPRSTYDPDLENNFNIPNYGQCDLIYLSRSIRTLVYRQERGNWRDVYYDAGLPEPKWTLHLVLADVGGDPYNSNTANQRNVQFAWNYIMPSMSSAELIKHWYNKPLMAYSNDVDTTIVHNWEKKDDLLLLLSIGCSLRTLRCVGARQCFHLLFIDPHHPECIAHFSAMLKTYFQYRYAFHRIDTLKIMVVSHPTEDSKIVSENETLIRQYCLMTGLYFAPLASNADRPDFVNLLERVITLAHEPFDQITETRKEHMSAFFSRTDFGKDVAAFLELKRELFAYPIFVCVLISYNRGLLLTEFPGELVRYILSIVINLH